MKKAIIQYILSALLILNINHLSAAMTANEYKNIIGRGMATDEAKNMDEQTMADFKARGFDNIRIRVDASKCYTDSHLDVVVGIVDRALAAGIVPIVAWNNNDAEARANNTDRTNFINWWTLVASKLADRSDRVSFNLMLEISDGSPLRENISVYESWTQGAVDAIRAISPTRVLILSSPDKKSTGLERIPSGIYQNDNYMMAEWHLYASGPNQNGGQKNWEGDGSDEDKENVTSIIDLATAFTSSSGIPTYFGAWMPYSQDGLITQYEAEAFGTFMLEQLSIAHIPWTVNAIGNLYDDENHEWRVIVDKDGTDYNMEILVDILMSVGTFLWDDNNGGDVPLGPSDLNATIASCSQIDLTWIDNADNEDAYKVKQSTDGGITYTLIETLPANTESYSVTGLAESTTYDLMVFAINSAGTSSRETITATTTDCYIPVYYTLTTNVIGSGSISPSGGSYLEGSSVTLTVTPTDNWSFESWSGDVTGTDETVTIIMDDNKNITATFIEDPIGDITVSLDPSDDAYVKSTVANTNFGGSDYLKVNADNKQAFMKFDLSTIGTVSSAELQVTSNGPGTVQLWKVVDDAWDEMSITWNTKLVNKVLLGTYVFPSASTQSLNVSYYINAHAEKDDAASFGLVEVNGTNVILDSKEGTNGPKLTVTHDGEPKNAGLFSSVYIKAYPNPSNGTVLLHINDVEFSGGTIKVVNTSGIVVDNFLINNTISELDLTNQPQGLYLLVISYNNQTFTENLMITK